MIVDSHHHLWRYTRDGYDWIDSSMSVIARDFSLVDAELIMKENGVSGSVVVQAQQSRDETRELLELSRSNTFIKGVVGWIDLESENLMAQLKEFDGEDKLCGFRHVLQNESDNRHVLRPKFMDGLRLLSEADYRYDILIFERQLEGALDMMTRLPSLNCVVDHIAKPQMTPMPSEHWKTYMSHIGHDTSAYCKLSGLVTEVGRSSWSYETFAPYLEHLFHSFGEDRLMFGSDWPVCLLAGEYAQVKSIISIFIARYCPKAAPKIWGQNARQFYGLL